MNAIEAANLLPCPFCGNPAELHHATQEVTDGTTEHAYWIVCNSDDCGCELGYWLRWECVDWGTFDSKESAMDAWNYRAEIR